jgi:hypothetical protein
MKERRKQQVLKRKNFLPALLVTILLWFSLSGLIYFIDPRTFGAVPLFFVLLFITLLFTFSLLFAGIRRGLITSLSLSLFAVLSYLGVGNIINLLLIVAIAISIELYFRQR